MLWILIFVSITNVQINLSFGCKLHELGFIKIQWKYVGFQPFIEGFKLNFLSFLKLWD